MTGEQYERWRDFAVRMARLFPATARRPSRRWVVERVEDFLDRFAKDHGWIENWDASRLVPCTYRPQGYDYDHGVSDQMSIYEWDHLPWRVQQLEHDEKTDEFDDARDRWFGHVRCCVRAGLDLAAEPRAGVLGFRVRDLRLMYPEGVPEWITGFFVNRRGGPMTRRGFARLKDNAGVWL